MKFIVAARLSRKPRPGEDIEFPIEAQDKRATDWGVAQGWEYVGTAADYKSGTVPPWQRPRLRMWVNDPDHIAQYDGIVAIKTDRISRGTDEDFSEIEGWAVSHKKKLIVVGPDGGIQYPSRHDSDFWQWTAAKREARKEWEAIRERSMNRQADLRVRGKLAGGAIPFGYTVSGNKYNKTIVPTEEGRKYVPLIFQRVADGQSLLKIAQWLDSEVPPKYGQRWSAKSIAQMIRNRTYVGQRKADEIVNGKRQRGKGVTLLEVEPLVDAKLWLAANNRLDNAPRGGRRGPKNGERAMLTGVLVCGNCGAPMYRLKVRGGYVYYRCHGHLPQPKGCGVMVSTSLLESIVDEAMRSNQQVMFKTEFVPGENHEAEIGQIRLMLRDLATKGLSDDEEDAERDRLRDERDRLKALPVIDDQWIKLPVKDDDGNYVTYASKWGSSDLAGKRDMIKDFRVTFEWVEIDGQRHPQVGIVPLWADEAQN